VRSLEDFSKRGTSGERRPNFHRLLGVILRENRELKDHELDLVSGGYTKQKPNGTAAGNVATKWSLAHGAVA
jgi:hypothetical protein